MVLGKKTSSKELKKMSYEEAYKLCDEKRLEIKLHRVENPVQFDERGSAKGATVTARKRKRDSAKQEGESTISVKKKKSAEFLTDDQIPLSSSKRCKAGDVRVLTKKRDCGTAKETIESSLNAPKKVADEVYQ